MLIDKALKQALADTDISAAELARRMEVSRAYISQLTSGKRGVTEDMLTTIADKLGCSVSIDVRFKQVE